MRFWTPLEVPVPAGTAASSPFTLAWTLYPGYVRKFEIQIPAGHNGLTGLRLTYMGRPIIPFDLTAFLIGSGRTFEVPYEDQIMNWGLQAQAYNTDVWPHTFYLWADVDPHIPGQPAAVTSPRLAAAAAPGALAAIRTLTSSPAGR